MKTKKLALILITLIILIGVFSVSAFATTTIKAPIISPNSGKFAVSQTVTITAPTAGTTIYYTTDGITTPTASSTKYEGAFTVNETVGIKAIAINEATNETSAVTNITIKKDTDATEKRLIVFGDSIPAGDTLPSPTDENFARLMGSRSGVSFANYGISGQTSAELKAAMVDNRIYDTEIASADAITITIGGNDLMEVFYGLVATQYNNSDPKPSEEITADDVVAILADNTDSRYLATLLAAATVINNGYDAVKADFETRNIVVKDNIQTMITHIKSINSTAEIYVTTQYNPYKGITLTFPPTDVGAFFESGLTAENVGFNARIKELTNCTVVDMYTEFDTSIQKVTMASATPLDLDFHPNSAGHELYAQTLSDAMWVDKPTITPNGGNFDVSQRVAITPTTTGSTIYYTTNGDTPTAATGTLYIGEFTVTDTATVKAIAVKSGMVASGVVSATFTENTYNVSVTKGIASHTTAAKDTSVTVTADAAPAGERFKNWTITGATVADVTQNPLIFTMPTNAVTLTANYEVIPTVVTGVTVSPSNVTVQKGLTQQFGASVLGTGNPSQAVNWAVEGNTDSGTNITTSGLLTIAPSETAATVTVRATSTIDNTQSGTAVATVSDVPVIMHTVTPSAGANGSISPNVATLVSNGGDVTFTFTPSAGYEVDTVTVDGAVVTPTNNAYTISNVQKDLAINVTFKSQSAPPAPPKITAGENQQGEQGQSMSFTSDAEYSDFVRVDVDGITLTRGTHYTDHEGSTIITLLDSYTSTLAAGVHTISIVSTTGTAAAQFTVTAHVEPTPTPTPTPTPSNPAISPLTGVYCKG